MVFETMLVMVMVFLRDWGLDKDSADLKDRLLAGMMVSVIQ